MVKKMELNIGYVRIVGMKNGETTVFSKLEEEETNVESSHLE